MKVSNLRVYLDMATKDVDTILVVPSQPSNSWRRSQDEEVEEPRRRQRIPSSRSFVIVFEVEPAHESSGEVIFAGCFHNEDTEVHVWSQVKGVGYYWWLYGPMNHLPRER